MKPTHDRPITVREAADAAAREGMTLSEYLPYLEAQLGPAFRPEPQPTPSN